MQKIYESQDKGVQTPGIRRAIKDYASIFRIPITPDSTTIQNPIQRILIYRVGNLGDTLCTIPAMVAIRNRFPHAWIGLLTNKEAQDKPDPEDILKNNDFIDEIITYRVKRIYEFGYLWNLLKKLRSLRIDLLVYFSLSKSSRQRLIRDWFFFNSTGCRRLVGFKLPKPVKTFRENGITTPVFPREVERLMTLVEPLGIDPKNIEFRLPIGENDKRAVDILWNRYALQGKTPIVAICPDSKFPVNRWRISHFAQVASILNEKFGAAIIILGGPGQKKSGEDISIKAGNSIVNLIGKTNYMEAAEIISRCNLLVSNDTGLVHAAAAVGTSVVGIYSSRNFPGAWHPWGDGHTILRDDSAQCRFCFKTECETKECINNITVEHVIDACSAYLT